MFSDNYVRERVNCPDMDDALADAVIDWMFDDFFSQKLWMFDSVCISLHDEFFETYGQPQ